MSLSLSLPVFPREMAFPGGAGGYDGSQEGGRGSREAYAYKPLLASSTRYERHSMHTTLVL